MSDHFFGALLTIRKFQCDLRFGHQVDDKTLQDVSKLLDHYLEIMPKGKPGPSDKKRRRRADVFFSIYNAKQKGVGLEVAAESISRDREEYDRIIDWFSKGRYADERKAARNLVEFSALLKLQSEEGFSEWLRENFPEDVLKNISPTYAYQLFKESDPEN